MSKITRATAHEIHNGERTQTQLHEILPSNFSTIKTIVSKPQKPIPPPLTPFEPLFELLNFFVLTFFWYVFIVIYRGLFCQPLFYKFPKFFDDVFVCVNSCAQIPSLSVLFFIINQNSVSVFSTSIGFANSVLCNDEFINYKVETPIE